MTKSTSTVLDLSTMHAVGYLTPLIAALNALHMAKDVSQDAVFAAEKAGINEDDAQWMRDMASDMVEQLLPAIAEIAETHNLNIHFNRLDGDFVLLSR